MSFWSFQLFSSIFLTTLFFIETDKKALINEIKKISLKKVIFSLKNLQKD